MANVTMDGHSLSLDGRRIWIVSGTLHPARTHPDQWTQRLRAARHFGLNTVEVPVVWAHHEPLPGKFDFSGSRDVAEFIRLAHEEGLRVIVRVGPYVGEGYDLGGLPAWLVPQCERRLRTGSSEFLQACSRYLSKLCGQLADLQATRRGPTPGPIVLVQYEHAWHCEDDDTARAYLGELGRFLREGGMTVPMVNRNQLYAGLEADIHAWDGYVDLFAMVRQLGAVYPDRPRLVMGLESGAMDLWGEPRRSQKTPTAVQRAVCEVLAAGGQFNLAPFAGGTAFGFDGGRIAGRPDGFVTTNRDESGPLSESGLPNAAYFPVRRACLFASQFERVFTSLDSELPPIMVAPEAIGPSIEDPVTGATRPRKGSNDANMTFAQSAGSQGSVVFVLTDAQPGGRKRYSTTLLLPDGSALPVDLGDLPVAWYLFDVHLSGRSRLDYASFCPLGLVGSTLVLFGPSGAEGSVSVNGSAFSMTVPRGKTPNIERHEDATIVLLNEDLADATVFTRDAVHIGAAGLDAEGRPLPHADHKSVVTLDGSGEEEKQTIKPEPTPRAKPALSDWSRADQAAYLDGSSPRFARIDGPKTMESLGTSSGYGWMRFELTSGAARKPKVALLESGDRLHTYLNGKFIAIAGVGPGSETDVVTLPLKRGSQVITILIDNLGRLDAGNAFGEPKGLFGHAWEVKPAKIGNATIEQISALDPFALRPSPIYGLQRGDRTDERRLTWAFAHRKKSPALVAIDPAAPIATPCFILVNGEPIGMLGPGGRTRLVLDEEPFKRGNNTLEIAVAGDFDEIAPLLEKSLTLFEADNCLTERAELAFARWEAPPADAFEPVAKTKLSGKGAGAFAGQPCWWRCVFGVKHTRRPLMLELTGMSKGQLMLNGENLGRYFVQTHAGEAVPPQLRYYLPEPLLRTAEPNELLLFDEHGFTPDKVKLAYDN